MMTSLLRTNLFLAPESIDKNVDSAPIITKTSALEKFFAPFRKNIIGRQQIFESPFGQKKIMYADWTATGKAYRPIEDCIQSQVMPFLANTHTETTITGTLMSKAYEEAKMIVKRHVHATENDVLIFCGSGMTAAVNKLQRILGIRKQERMKDYLKESCHLQVDETLRPIVFVTHMEHHSNQISWLETIADVEIINRDENGNVDLKYFRNLLEQFKHRKNKIAAVTACSNVTGIQTHYHAIARLIHEYGGLCFVDFAASAPYVDINMHPDEKGTDLDAICFSPHKFLGGAGTPGVLIFNNKMYKNSIPDHPGGGTVVYSNPWKVHEYVDNIEQREDGGTPPFLQGIKVAMCIKLKEQMGVENILQREEEILRIVYTRFSKIENIKMLEPDVKKRLGIISFIVEGAHYNLIVKMLNDRFGIQTRGGCSCAATYGHLLLQVGRVMSLEILDQLHLGNLSYKPGWVRLSVHPTMTNSDIDCIMNGIEKTASHFQEWAKDYTYEPATNEYSFNGIEKKEQDRMENWFNISKWK